MVQNRVARPIDAGQLVTHAMVTKRHKQSLCRCLRRTHRPPRCPALKMIGTRRQRYISYVTSNSRVFEAVLKENYFQGNLDERCTDALVWELMLQAGPVGMKSTNLLKNVISLTNVISECTPTKRPHLDGSPRLRVLRVSDRGGRGICL